VAEAFLVGVAVLRNDRGYPPGMTDSQAEAGGRAVIEHVHRKPIKADDFGETVDHAGDVVERVTEFFPRRHVGLTEPGKVRRDHMKSVSKKRDQVAEHVTRAGKAMQEQQLGGAGRSRFAIEQLETVDIGRAISDRRHQTLLSLDDFFGHNDEAASPGRRRFSWTVNPSCWAPYAPVFPTSKSLEPSRWPIAKS